MVAVEHLGNSRKVVQAHCFASADELLQLMRSHARDASCLNDS